MAAHCRRSTSTHSRFALHARRLALPALLGAVAIICATGCSSWKRPQRAPEAILSDTKTPDRMRLTTREGEIIVVKRPMLRGDSIVGTFQYKVTHPDQWDETRTVDGRAIALSDIRRVELRKFDAVKTAILVGVGVGATVVAVAIATNDDDPPRYAAPPSSGGGGGGDGCIFCSCPLIYSGHGAEEWTLDSGTFGGAFLRSLAYTDLDLLEALEDRGGALRLRLQAGDKESDHIDELGLLAVDHSPSVSVATDPVGRIHTYGPTLEPISAVDSRGRDARAAVRVPDDESWESALAVRDTASASDLRETLTLEFGRDAGVTAARLVLRGHKTAWAGHLMRAFVAAHGTATSAWYAAMDAEPLRAGAFRQTLASEVHLNVSVWDGKEWKPQGSVWGGGPEIAKTHVVPLDLAGVEGATVRVRLESAPSFWLVDWAGLDVSPEAPFMVQEASLRSAVAGDGTDWAPALRAKDGAECRLETGDAVAVVFDAPVARPGTKRTYLSRTTGWYRYHAPETGPPDTELLDYLAREPRGITKMSITWMNRAIRSVASLE